MNEFFIFGFLAAGVAWYGRWAAGISRSYDSADEFWWGLRRDGGRSLREEHGDDGARTILENRCHALARWALFAAMLFTAAGITVLFFQG